MKELCAVKPLEGVPFSDTLDGYFPLAVSVQQMMARNGFDSAWFTLGFAPFVDVPHLLDTDAVPFSLRNHLSGMIGSMALVGSFTNAGFRLEGTGSWYREEPARSNRTLTGHVRLGEPAIVTGVGVSAKIRDTHPRATVALARILENVPSDAVLQKAANGLGWKAAQAQFLDASNDKLLLSPDPSPQALNELGTNSFSSIFRDAWTHILTEVND